VCLAVLALAAAWSSPALADDGVPDISIPAVPDLTEAANAVLEEAGLEELDSLTAVDPSIALPAVPAQKTAAEPATAGAVAAPPPEPAAETPVEAPPAVNPEPDAPPAPDVVQTAPTNMNISVRIDSPGDNGSVGQVNVAASTGGAAATAAPPAETAPQYQPDPPQYQQPIPASAAPAADSAPQPPAAEPAQGVEGWTWNWNWNCGDAIPDIPLPPEVGTQNWTWNWDWDCGDPDPIPTNTSAQNTSQYQPGVTQYRPININISIRINSPGNDGPVSQSNVAVLLAAPTLPAIRIEVPVSPVGQAQSFSGGSEAMAPLATLAAFVDEIGADPAEAAGAVDECCSPHEPRSGVTGAAEEPQSLLLPQAPPTNGPDITPRERFRASVAVTVRLAKASETAARNARPAPKPAQLRPAPQTSAGPKREQAAVLSAAGFAPVNAPDGRLGQLLLVVAAFAFAIALADASRSVAAEVRAAGEDPDPPPDSPG
jgi:hypothetical protein